MGGIKHNKDQQHTQVVPLEPYRESSCHIWCMELPQIRGRVHLIALAILIAIAVATICLYGLFSVVRQSDISKNENHTQTSATAAVPALENVPLYPSAEPTSVEDDPADTAHRLREISFVTTAQLEDVRAFYKEKLPELGWLPLKPTSGDIEDDREIMRFTWPNADKARPWNLDLYIHLGRHVRDQGRVTLVYLQLLRWPDTTQLPLYKDPRNVETQNTAVKSGYGDEYLPEWQATYLTYASPDDVEAYYECVLPEQGWVQENYHDKDFPEGLIFSFRIRGFDGPGAAVNIVAKPDVAETGRTNVAIRVRGDMLPALP
jgi:hypothetical protein